MAWELTLAACICAQPISSAMKYVGKLLKPKCIYLCCFKSNITDLNAEDKKLGEAIQVLEANNNVEEIIRTVPTWLTDSKELRANANRIETEAKKVESSYVKVRARYNLSREAVKTTADMVLKQQDTSKFENISSLRTAAAKEIPLGTDVYDFESRKQIEEDIMKALRADKKNMIGICGMGGIGKTTMAKRIKNRALKERAFTEVAMVTVSQTVDALTIQNEIGRSLNLELERESEEARVQKLHERLGKERILLILDDVWGRLDLSNLGIPSCDDDGSKGCTILITSRNSGTLDEMDVRLIFGVKQLPEDEAWLLFSNIAGLCVDNPELSPTAKQVARQCDGLPIALTIVGRALKNQPKHKWEDALQELKNCTPNDNREFTEKVHNCIKCSYDFLIPKDANFLLLCSLFPKDSNISIDQLTYFGRGLSDDIGSFENARNSMLTSITTLKDRSLLLNSEDEDCVRMHDIVHDVCKIISKRNGLIDGDQCSWLFHSGKGIELSKYSKLLLLLLEKVDNNYDNFFEGIATLKVLSIESDSLVRTLPYTLKSLEKLRTLRIDFCSNIETISIVGAMENLEILICTDCESLKELLGIKGRVGLKILDLSRCNELQIDEEIISSLVGLEGLKMMGIFNDWDANNIGRKKSARLTELKSLPKLRCLEIQVKESVLAAQNVQLSSKLERFDIQIISSSPGMRFAHEKKYDKKLALPWKEGTSFGSWIENLLLRDTEYLSAYGNGANKLECDKMKNIRNFELGHCKSVKNIAFPLIEYLHLYSLSEQVKICDAPISGFTNLSSILISGCPLLKNVGQLLVTGTNDCLPQLESLQIKDCGMMEQVFSCSQHENTSRAPRLRFPKLKKLELMILPNLTTFCQGIEGIDFPLLTEISIHGSPSMRSIVSTTSNIFSQVSLGSLKKLTTTALNPFWGYEFHEPSFNGLDFLKIDGYGGGMSLFTPSLTENLASLKELYIKNCVEISYVIEDERQLEGGGRKCLFPKLVKLELMNLPKLNTFCKWSCDVELPSLMLMEINGCSSMAKFTSGSLTAPKCLELEIENESPLDVFVKQDVSFGNMKKLNLYKIENPFRLDYTNINVSFFNGLEELHINGHSDTRSLFTSSMARRLSNLKKLYVDMCARISKVIEAEEEEENTVGIPPMFPKLEELHLTTSGELETFWECGDDVELPSLRKLTIFLCPKMSKITLGTLRAPNLRIVEIGLHEYTFDTTKDLNDMLALTPDSENSGSLSGLDEHRESDEEWSSEREADVC